MFTNTIVELGNIIAGTRWTVTFSATPDTISVEILPPDCSCVSPEWDENFKEVRITYIPKAIPRHLELAGNTHYNSNKTITVNYISGGKPRSQTLSIKAKIVNK